MKPSNFIMCHRKGSSFSASAAVRSAKVGSYYLWFLAIQKALSRPPDPFSPDPLEPAFLVKTAPRRFTVFGCGVGTRCPKCSEASTMYAAVRPLRAPKRRRAIWLPCHRKAYPIALPHTSSYNAVEDCQQELDCGRFVGLERRKLGLPLPDRVELERQSARDPV
eukprot:5449988-Pleurochrysis_carterae.AAC.1